MAEMEEAIEAECDEEIARISSLADDPTKESGQLLRSANFSGGDSGHGITLGRHDPPRPMSWDGALSDTEVRSSLHFSFHIICSSRYANVCFVLHSGCVAICCGLYTVNCLALWGLTKRSFACLIDLIGYIDGLRFSLK